MPARSKSISKTVREAHIEVLRSAIVLQRIADHMATIRASIPAPPDAVAESGAPPDFAENLRGVIAYTVRDLILVAVGELAVAASATDESLRTDGASITDPCRDRALDHPCRS